MIRNFVGKIGAKVPDGYGNYTLIHTYMQNLLECRFLKTVLSAGRDDEPIDWKVDFDEFYMSATSLLAGDWQIAGREYAKALYILHDSPDGGKRILTAA